MMNLISCLSTALILSSSFAFALPQKMPQAEIEHRQNSIKESYKIISEVMIKADQNPKLAAYLEHMHFPRSQFDRMKIEASGRAQKPINEAELSYRNVDPNRCGNVKEFNQPASRVAFTSTATRVISLCDPFFQEKDEYNKAHFLLHEQLHAQGYHDECTAEGVAFLIFYAAGKTVMPEYLRRCGQLNEYIGDLLKEDVKRSTAAATSAPEKTSILYESQDPKLLQVMYVDVKKVFEKSKAGIASKAELKDALEKVKTKLNNELELLKKINVRNRTHPSQAGNQEFVVRNEQFKKLSADEHQQFEMFAQKKNDQVVAKIKAASAKVAVKRGLKKVIAKENPPSNLDITSEVIKSCDDTP